MGGNEIRLKDGLYASSHGTGGLVLDMPAKDPKKKEKAKVGGMVCCKAGKFTYPSRGYVEHLYNRSAITHIGNTTECDK